MQSEIAGFADLNLSEDMLATLAEVGYLMPSPIQAAFIPKAIEGGDVIGQARTGTGKTAAFSIPILETIDPDLHAVQALVLTPTRELGQQVADELVRLSAHHPIKAVCCVGGKALRQQITSLQEGAQVVIGTPGRVIDLLHRKILRCHDLEMIVLDEADRMLDIGFRPDIERILKQCPDDRQTLLLSATLPPPVERLAMRYMKNPIRVDMSPVGGVSGEQIDQYYLTVDGDRKFGALVKTLAQERPQQAIVFTRTKRGSEEVHKKFRGRLEGISFIHGDLPQTSRDRVMKKFRDGSIRLLVATDVMGRGIDVSGISHIINYDIPLDCDDYVHRIGRTGRLSSTESRGKAITFVDPSEGPWLTEIEKRINRLLDPYEVHGYEVRRHKKVTKSIEGEVQPARSFQPTPSNSEIDDWTWE